jgi:hypothetical protein
MALYGANLAKTIRPGTTWNQADDVLAELRAGINACYSSLSLWEDWKAHGTIDALNLAVLQTISADDAATTKEMLDTELAGLMSLETLVQEHTGDTEGDEALPDDYLAMLQSKAKTSSDLIAMVDRLFHTSVGSQVSDAIVPVVGSISDTLANALSKVIGNFLAGIWWVIAIGFGVIYLWHKWGGAKLLQ